MFCLWWVVSECCTRPNSHRQLYCSMAHNISYWYLNLSNMTTFTSVLWNTHGLAHVMNNRILLSCLAIANNLLLDHPAIRINDLLTNTLLCICSAWWRMLSGYSHGSIWICQTARMLTSELELVPDSIFLAIILIITIFDSFTGLSLIAAFTKLSSFYHQISSPGSPHQAQ